MYKIYKNELDFKNLKAIKRSENSRVFRLNNGDFLKIYSPVIIKQLKQIDISLEEKIMNAKVLTDIPEIIVPKAGVYDNPKTNNFIGQITPPAPGINLNQYDETFSILHHSDLHGYTRLLYNIFDAVKRANERNIIFPDLCTCDNIFVDNERISFIDYDGIQIGKHKVLSISTALGEPIQYLTSKYYRDGLFTNELDKKSMLYLYFLTAFNVNLNTIGLIDPHTGQKVTLELIFSLLGLKDEQFLNKAHKILSSNMSGDYIMDDMIRINNNYNLIALEQVSPSLYIKKLIKKK